MNEVRYFVERQEKTVLITEGTPVDTVRIFRSEEPMVTYICANVYDALNIAEVLIEGPSGLSKGCVDYLIYVDHVRTECPGMKYPVTKNSNAFANQV